MINVERSLMPLDFVSMHATTSDVLCPEVIVKTVFFPEGM
jgi:hypothetical protein